jgi:alpha-1,6-mannosyltransferase
VVTNVHFHFRYKNEKTDPDLVMDSDPDEDDVPDVGRESTDFNKDNLPASSAADMARAYHSNRANVKTSMATEPSGKSIGRKPSASTFSFTWDVMLLLYSWSLVLICPYTKVEESFNMQAMHDIMFHQHNIEAYDHLVFTGPVARTLLGSVVVSTASSPIAIVLSLLNAPNWVFAYMARMVLATFLVASLSFLRYSVHKTYDSDKSWWLGFVNLMQFHIPFYISRSLPNTFALFFTNMALGCILRNHHKYAVALLTASAVIFRSDTLVFAAPFVLSILLSKNLTFFQFFKTGLITAVPCISMSVAVDSFFWRRLLWPEALVFLFNTVQNKSGEWGTSPWHW